MADQDVLITFKADTSELDNAQRKLSEISGKDGLGGLGDAGKKAAAGVEAAANSTKHYADELGEVNDQTKGAIEATSDLSTKANTAAKSTGTLTTAMKGLSTVLKGFVVGAILGFITTSIRLLPQLVNKLAETNEGWAKFRDRIIAVKNAFTDWIGITSKGEREIQKLNDAISQQNKDLQLTAKYYREVAGDAKKALDAEKQILLNKQQQIINSGKTRQITNEELLQLKDIAIELQILDKQYEELGASKQEVQERTKQTAVAMRSLKEELAQINREWEDFANNIRDILGIDIEGKMANISDAAMNAVKPINDMNNEIDKGSRAFKQFEAAQEAALDSTGGKPKLKIIPDEEELDKLGLAIEGLQAVSNILSGIAERRAAAFDAQISDLERLRDAELKNTELSAAQRERIEERYQKKINKLKTDQAKAQRRADITQAIINTALAISQAAGNPIRAALAAIVGAAQIAIIRSQPLPKFREGGAVKGARHEQGGVVIEAEGGEHVIRREAVSKYGSDFIEKINKMQLPTSIKMAELPAGLIANVMNHAGLDHEKLGKVIGEQLSKQPKVSIAMDESGFTKYIQQGSYKAQYANRKFRAG